MRSIDQLKIDRILKATLDIVYPERNGSHHHRNWVDDPPYTAAAEQSIFP